MPRITRLAVAVVAVLALAACTQQEPEISVQEQVPAAAREQAAAEEGAAEEGAAEGEGEPAEEGTPSTWVAVDVDFIEFDSELPAGPVTLTLDNTQANLPHNIVIEELGSSPVVEDDGGGTDTATIELEPGEYTFFCSIPGHRGTMEETVTVS